MHTEKFLTFSEFSILGIAAGLTVGALYHNASGQVFIVMEAN